MFDIGFFEICLIGVIALLVIGPEKLPRTARTIGLWVGKARGAIRTVKYEIDEQIRMEEMKESIREATNEAENKIDSLAGDTKEAVKEIEEDLKDGAENLKKRTEYNK